MNAVYRIKITPQLFFNKTPTPAKGAKNKPKTNQKQKNLG